MCVKYLPVSSLWSAVWTVKETCVVSVAALLTVTECHGFTRSSWPLASVHVGKETVVTEVSSVTSQDTVYPSEKISVTFTLAITGALLSGGIRTSALTKPPVLTAYHRPSDLSLTVPATLTLSPTFRARMLRLSP